MRNPLFEEYYKGLGIVSVSEWNDFIASLQQDLPITFRVTGFREQNKELLRLIKNRFAGVDATSLDESASTVQFHNLSWYPEEMAWQLDASRYTVRKDKELKKLHQFLVSEMESGNISRQEAVSMLPPLLLDVQAQHVVLDMCAAPGSKSAQLVELLHVSAEAVQGTGGYAEPSGVVIANDFDQKRCYMMVHQVKRLQSPCALVTHQDASCFPRLYLRSEAHGNELLFDRILADVPCSGDGTLRKNPDVWLRWTPNQGIANHYLQQRILRRAVELLRTPGDDADVAGATASRVVYSTCSFNPIENEAVVASILEASQGALQLVDLSRLPSFLTSSDGGVEAGRFRVRPGLTTWRVMTNKAQWFESFDQVPSNKHGNIRPSLFPPADVTRLHLSRCLRVVPHDQNTGGFFIAVLEKVARLPWMKAGAGRQRQTPDQTCDNVDGVPLEIDAASNVSSIKRHNADSVPDTASVAESKKPRLKQENPFRYVDPTSDADWPAIRDYYGIVEQIEGVPCSQLSTDQSLPFCPAQLLYRSMENEPRRRQFYYTNRLVKDVVLAMQSRGVRLINTGVRMFSLMEDKQFTGYRLLQDGVDLVDAFIAQASGSSRRIHLPSSREGYADLVLLLREEMPLVSGMSAHTRLQWERISPGPVLIEFVPPVWEDLDTGENPEHMPRCRFVFAGWRGTKSLRHYVGRHERLHLMRLANLSPEPAIAGRTPVKVHPEAGDEDDSPAPSPTASTIDQ